MLLLRAREKENKEFPECMRDAKAVTHSWGAKKANCFYRLSHHTWDQQVIYNTMWSPWEESVWITSESNQLLTQFLWNQWLITMPLSAGASRLRTPHAKRSVSSYLPLGVQWVPAQRAVLPRDALTLWLRTYPVPFSHSSWRGWGEI